MNCFKIIFSTSFLFSFLLTNALQGHAQNTGIGTTNPAYRLTVIPDADGNGIVQEMGGVQIGFNTHSTWGGILKTLTNHDLRISTNNNAVPTMIFSTARNIGIGIGVNSPAFKLDLGGRMRLQHTASNNQTAGFWLDGTTTDTRSFIGTIDDDHMGIWGNGGAGWNLAMNVENGNTGIGTSAPSAKLDLNGSLRIRGTFPKTGSKLISLDVNGNATWNEPVAFHASGCSGTQFSIPANTWTRYYFSNTMEYNIGLHFQPVNSLFRAPYRGIYRFTVQSDFPVGYNTTNQGLALKGLRNGVPVTFESHVQDHGGVTAGGNQYNNYNSTDMTITTDVLLEEGDYIWVEVYQNESVSTNNYTKSIWFTGNLITRL